MNNLKSHRIWAYDSLKIFALLLIVVRHAGIYTGSVDSLYVAVDMFYFIAGFLLVCKLKNNTDITFKEYFSRRILQLWLPYLFALLLLIFFTFLYGKPLYDNWIDFVFEIFMISGGGLPIKSLNFPTWFLTALIICELIFFVIIKYLNKKIYIPMLSFLMFAGIIFYLIQFQNIEQWTLIFGFLPASFLRAFIDMSLGIVSYFILIVLNNKINKCSFSSILTLLFNIFEVVFILLIFWLCICNDKKLDYFVWIIMYLLFFASCFERSLLNKIGKTFIIRKISKIQYFMFLNHILLIKFIKKLIQPLCLNNAWFLIIIIVGVIIGSYAIFLIYKYTSKLIKYFLVKNKNGT